MVCSHQTFGEFRVWHPHWHTIVLESGFDRHDTFFSIPLGATAALTEIWRRRVESRRTPVRLGSVLGRWGVGTGGLRVLPQPSPGGQGQKPGLSNPSAPGSGGVQPAAAHQVGPRVRQVLQELDQKLHGGEQSGVRLEKGIVL